MSRHSIERMLEEHRDHFNTRHLFRVWNLDMNDGERQASLVPGHMAEGFVFNRNYLVDYVGENVKGSPLLASDTERMPENEPVLSDSGWQLTDKRPAAESGPEARKTARQTKRTQQ